MGLREEEAVKDETVQQRARIVVGVDGSENSRRALRWALTEARLRGMAVEVVHCWHFPYVADPAGMVAYPSAALQESAEALVRESLQSMGDDTQGIAITTRVEQAPGAETLVSLSESAELLVIGRRGHGGFLSLVLGSVAQQVVSHAHCPVVVVGPE